MPIGPGWVTNGSQCPAELSFLSGCCRNLSEPVMTYKLHKELVLAASKCHSFPTDGPWPCSPQPGSIRITWQSSASPALWCPTASAVGRAVLSPPSAFLCRGCGAGCSLPFLASSLRPGLWSQGVWRARGCHSLETNHKNCFPLVLIYLF